MGEHVDNRKYSKKSKKRVFEGDELSRQRRVTFKNYLREVEEELLEADLEDPLDDLDEDQNK